MKSRKTDLELGEKQITKAALANGDYKFPQEKNGISTPYVIGTTTRSRKVSRILVTKPTKAEEAAGYYYDPYEHRDVAHPTSYFETLIHLLKGCIGSGILAMPLAFYHAGVLFGIIACMIIVVICAYCMNVIVKCAYILCQRLRVPSLEFSQIAEKAFETGPAPVRRWSGVASGCINLFLATELLGSCCVYVVFIAMNVQQVVDHYVDLGWPIQYYMAIQAPFLVGLNLMPNLKYLAPFSMLANGLLVAGFGITFYYIFTDLPSLTNSGLPNFKSWSELPLFFGTVIFALEGIGVVMPLENNMKNPRQFIGRAGVLNLGLAIAGVLYTSIGFFGYIKYGANTQASITLNLPTEEVLAQSVKVMIALAILFTHALQFYIPRKIIAKSLKKHFTSYPKTVEFSVRISLVLATVGIAAAFPDLGTIISLIGAVTLSALGLIFPSIIELVTYWEDPGLGKYQWRLWKNLFLISFGIIGLVTGTYSSLVEIIEK